MVVYSTSVGLDLYVILFASFLCSLTDTYSPTLGGQCSQHMSTNITQTWAFVLPSAALDVQLGLFSFILKS